MKQRGIGGAVQLYNSNGLWEERALLASALALNGNNDGDRLAEVQRRAEDLSPFARLTLAEALISIKQESKARAILDDVLKDANIGTDVASIPVGARDGWENGTSDASAAALSLLLQLDTNRGLQAKFARFLSYSADYQSRDSQTNRLRALWKYDQAHPGARKIGALTVTLNGQSVKVPAEVDYKPLEIPLPRVWKDGDNTFANRARRRGRSVLERRGARLSTGERRSRQKRARFPALRNAKRGFDVARIGWAGQSRKLRCVAPLSSGPTTAPTL